MKSLLKLWCLIICINYSWHIVFAYIRYEGDECELHNGNLGICTPFQNCDWAIKGLKQRQIQYPEIAKTRCSFMRNIEIICCGNDNKYHGPPLIRPTTPKLDVIKVPSHLDPIIFPDKIYEFTNNDNTLSTSRIGGQKIEAACSKYIQNNRGEIVLAFNILGGKEAVPGEFPHMASIGYTNENTGKNESPYNFNCGGTIINEYYVLTAAHCVSNQNSATIVRMGKTNLFTNDNGEKTIDREISDIIVHPLYRSNRRYHDIALIRLKKPIEFNNYVRPACLRTNLSDIESDIDLYVTGWGITSVEQYTKSNILLKTNVTSVPLPSCNSTLLDYGRDRRLPFGVDLGHLCAFDPKAERDSCEGDSGGPIQMIDENGMATVVGITSFGVSCGSTLPSVYTRVAYYAEWIEVTAWSTT